MDIRDDSLFQGEDADMNGNHRRRIFIVHLDGENDGEVNFLMGKLKDRLRSQGIDVDTGIEETRERFNDARQAWRK